MQAEDGKSRLTDVADTEQLFRLDLMGSGHIYFSLIFTFWFYIHFPIIYSMFQNGTN